MHRDTMKVEIITEDRGDWAERIIQSVDCSVKAVRCTISSDAYVAVRSFPVLVDL